MTTVTNMYASSVSSSSPHNDRSSSPSSPSETTTSRILNFLPERFSLLNLPNCDISRQDPDYEYATDNDDDDDDDDDEGDHGIARTVRSNKSNAGRSKMKKRRRVLSKSMEKQGSLSSSSSSTGIVDDSGSSGDDDDDDDDNNDIVIEKIITSRKDTLGNWNKICQMLNTSEIMNGSLWQDQSNDSNKQQNSQIMQERFLVKWKDLSYIHCSWETRDVLLYLTLNGVHQLNSFMKRRNDFDDDNNEVKSDLLGSLDCKNGHDAIKSFVMIDRILDVKSFGTNNNNRGVILDKSDPNYEEGMGRTFLIKWCGLPYSESTYEHERDLILMKVEYESHHDAFVKRHTKSSKRQVKDNMAKHDRLVHHLRRLFRTSAQFHDANMSNMEGYVKELQGQTYRNKGTLREYQAEGVAWMIANYVNGRSSILADEMGLGKTVQTAVFLNTLNDAFGNRGPFLIVAPLSTVIQWQREISSWTNLNVVLYTGNAADRAMIREYEFAYVCDRPAKLRARQKYLKNCHIHNNTGLKKTWMVQVLVTTPETLLAKDQDELMSIDWEMLIIDEAHNRLKNRSSKFSMCLRNERFLYRRCLLLTGTPIQNNMDELWTLLNIIDPNVFADHDNFLSRYGNMQGKEQIDELHEVIRPYMLRRLKEDVEKDLPAREETIIEVELTSIQKQYYRALYEKNRKFLLQNKGSIDSVNIIMELRKCCNHPFLLNGVEDKAAQGIEIKSRQDEIDFLVKSSGKLVLLDKLLSKLKAGGHRVLIFSQFKIMLNIIEDYLQLVQYTYERIDGSITGKLRQLSIDRFQNNESSFIMLLTTKAGGVGINLTAADTCIIFDSDWNPQNDLQAQARCHRIGQTKDVKVYRFLTKKTYEMRLFHLGSMKLGLDKAVLQGVENKRENSITEQEAERLLRFGAYGVLSEDKNSTNENDSKSFMEEDIDTILLRRTKTQIHDRQTANGFNFSKASFKPANNDSLDGAIECDVDVDDPDFWTKIFAASDSKKENMATPACHDESDEPQDCQNKNESCESSGLEEAETKKTRTKTSHKKVGSDKKGFSTSVEDSDHNKRVISGRTITKASSLLPSKAHPEDTANQKGRHRKRRGAVDDNCSPPKSKRPKYASSSVISSPPNSTPNSIRRSPRLNRKKLDEVMGSAQNEMSYAVAVGIKRKLGIDEKGTTVVKSIPSKISKRGLPKRRLFSPLVKEDNPQGRVEMQKNVEPSKGKSHKAINPRNTPRQQRPGTGTSLGATSCHMDSGTSSTSTRVKCRQEEKLTEDESSITVTMLSSQTTRSVQREDFKKTLTSVPSNAARKRSSLHKRCPTSDFHVSNASFSISPITKWVGNSTCPKSTDTTKASLLTSTVVKRKQDEHVPTKTSSSTFGGSAHSVVSTTKSRKPKLISNQSADITGNNKEQKVTSKQQIQQIRESCTPLPPNKVKTQRGRKTRRPQYYVPPATKHKRRKTESSTSNSLPKTLSKYDSKQHQGGSEEGRKQQSAPQNATSTDDCITVEIGAQYNMPLVTKHKRKKTDASASKSLSKPLSNTNLKQHQGDSKKEGRKQPSAAQNDASVVDSGGKEETTVNQSTGINTTTTTLQSQSDKEIPTNISTKCWPFISSKDNMQTPSTVPSNKVVATTTITTVAKKAPSKRLSHGSVLERLFAT